MAGRAGRSGRRMGSVDKKPRDPRASRQNAVQGGRPKLTPQDKVLLDEMRSDLRAWLSDVGRRRLKELALQDDDRGTALRAIAEIMDRCGLPRRTEAEVQVQEIPVTLIEYVPSMVREGEV